MVGRASSADLVVLALDRRNAPEQVSGIRALVQIRDANHYQPIFHDLVDGKWLTDATSPAGKKTVQAVLDAIHAVG